MGSVVWFYHGIWSTVFKDLESSSNFLEENSKNGEFNGSVLSPSNFWDTAVESRYRSMSVY